MPRPSRATAHYLVKIVPAPMRAPLPRERVRSPAQLCRPACPGEGRESTPLQTLALHPGEPDGDQETKVGRVREGLDRAFQDRPARLHSVRPATAAPVSYSRYDPEPN